MEENKKWNAQWIWDEGISLTGMSANTEMVYFRRSFKVPFGTKCRLTVHVSADSRYRLWINGISVAVGPCQGDRFTHYYETLELGEYLKPGANVLAAKVVHYPVMEPFQSGKAGPEAVWRKLSGGFLLDGELTDECGSQLDTLHSDERWMCFRDHGYRLVPNDLQRWLGGTEEVRGNYAPYGWEQPGYEDCHWRTAVPFCSPVRSHGNLTPWQLFPRPTPLSYETEKRFLSVKEKGARDTGKLADSPDWQAFIRGEGTVTLQPGDRVWVELDAGELMTGYLRLDIHGGKGSIVKLLSAECYEHAESVPSRRVKGVRDCSSGGGKLIGFDDVYHAAGAGVPGAAEVYEPFWFRVFRFVRLEVEVGDEPIVLRRFVFRETGYPLEVKSTFSCSDDELNRLWEMSLLTMRRGMQDIYIDGPYYEQIQYTMDTFLETVFTYLISGDDRLPRKAIHDFHCSMLPSGMLQSRYPDVHGQVIPGFSLYWIQMLFAHYRYYGDTGLIRRYLHTMGAVLDWFERNVNEDGMVGQTPAAYWTYVDWVEDWSPNLGAPLCGSNGPITFHSLIYATTLVQAAELYESIGWLDAAGEMRARADKVNSAVRKYCWSDSKQYVQDGPGVEAYSQHAQIWAVLSGAVSGRTAQNLLERTLSDANLPSVNYPMSYFVFRALSLAGLYPLAFRLWDRWRALLAYNLTTLPETDAVSTRSDCHAWSCVPLSEFTSEILGVRPGEPGFQRIVVTPQPWGLNWAQGLVATKHGDVKVEWNLDGARFSIRVESPVGIALDVQLPDGSLCSNINGGIVESYCEISEGGNRY